MPCPRCMANPDRAIPGTDRTVLRLCAFDAAGQFTPDNWCCLTLALLMQYAGPPVCDTRTNSLRLLPLDTTSDRGWLILTAHGWRHTIVSAVHVGDHAPRPLTLALAERALAQYDAQAALLRARLTAMGERGRVTRA